MDLVSADCEKVDSHFFRIDAVFAESLDRIYVIECLWALLMNHLCDLLNRHHCTDFVIYKHGGYHDRVWSQNGFQCIHLYSALCIYRKVGDLEPLLLKIQCRLADCRMFYRGDDDVVSVSFVCHCTADECKVVRLRTTGSKQDLFFLYFQDSGDGLCRFFYVFLRIYTLEMHGRRVPEVLCHGLYYDVFDGIVASGGSGIIKINFHNFLFIIVCVLIFKLEHENRQDRKACCLCAEDASS